MRRRIYFDTSVIGGYFDPEFEFYSRMLFRDVHEGRSTAVVSDLTLFELESAPWQLRRIVDEIPESFFQLVEVTEEAKQLAQEYLAAGVIGARHQADAQHIAIATVQRIDVLASWNFKHIVNIARIQGYNSVNLRMGYPMLEIRSPREVVQYE